MLHEPPSFRRSGSAAAGVAMPLMSDAETWWARMIVGALIAVVGGLVAWAGWAAARST
jgi:TRAP-type C4-dicarboxylate transport system permease small subunit